MFKNKLAYIFIFGLILTLCLKFFFFIASPAKSLINTDTDTKIRANIEKLKSQDWQTSKAGADELTGIGNSALPALLEILQQNPSVALKGQTVFLLGRIGDEGAVPALRESLQDENAYIRRNAAIALGKIKDSRAVSTLLAVLSDTDVSVRERSAWALGEIGDTQAVVDLINQLTQEKEERVKSAIVKTLGELRDSRAALTLLQELQSPSNSPYKNKIVFSLGEIGDSRALSPLTEYLNKLQQDLNRLKTAGADPMIIFQVEQAIKIAEEAIQKID